MTERRAEYRVPGRAEIRQACLVPFEDPTYEPPTPEEVREAIRRAGYTGAQVGALLGVTGRTVRKWVGGERAIPYSAWRLLLVETGQAVRRLAAIATAADGQR